MKWGQNMETVPDFYIDQEKLKIIQDLLFSGFHVLLTGNPGCGKTFFGQAWARARGFQYHKVNCGAIRSPREWFGRWEFREGKGTVFVPSRFVEMIEQPSLIILDELNRTTPDNHNPIMNILDGNREVYVDELNRYLTVHPQTLFIATANKGRQHTGAYHMDFALEDRFQEIRLYLPPEPVIADILQERYSIRKQDAEAIARVTVKLDEMYDQDLLTKTMGLRPALAAGALVGKGNNMMTALRYAFVYQYPMDALENEQTLALQAIQGMVNADVFV